jgi:LuxR family maltose regulon positive regulatory protein
VTDAFWGPLCQAKLLLARGDRVRATEALLRAHPRTVRHTVIGQLVRARLTREQDHEGALRDVTVAVRTAASHGLLQTVAADGSDVLELIELAAWQAPDSWMEQLRHLLVPTWRAHAAGPIESLTERERDVLRLLPSRLTLGEISTQLYISQNTLKFHLRAIYRKLGTGSREDAVQAAREMRLLPAG